MLYASIQSNELVDYLNEPVVKLAVKLMKFCGKTYEILFNVSFFSAILISIKYRKRPLGHSLLKRLRLDLID